MNPAVFMLIVFLVSTILTVNLTNISSDSVFWLSRIIIIACYFAGVSLQYLSTKKTAINLVQIERDQIKIKTFAIRLLLSLLLVFSLLMDVLFSNWPALSFNFEYAVLLPFLIYLTPFYINFVEKKLPKQNDAYYFFGQFVLGKRHWCWQEQKQLILSWLVKLIFIPLMYAWLVFSVESYLLHEWSLSSKSWIEGLFLFGLSVDLLIASAGYIFASRLLNNEVLSTDSSWLGWISCLICYPPLIYVFLKVKQQTNDIVWNDWLTTSDVLYWIWAFFIISSWLIYWMSTISFGLKFSNLSWRGLVNTGPYRYAKHPAYLSKNIYWWLHAVPFIGVTSSYELIRNFSGLLFVSFVYYLRAYTEEKHLLRFIEYQDYYDYMKMRNIYSRVKKKLLWP